MDIQTTEEMLHAIRQERAVLDDLEAQLTGGVSKKESSVDVKK